MVCRGITCREPQTRHQGFITQIYQRTFTSVRYCDSDGTIYTKLDKLIHREHIEDDKLCDKPEITDKTLIVCDFRMSYLRLGDKVINECDRLITPP